MTQTAAPSRRFRTDVQGLRAIAVGLVLLYHAGVPPFSGGYIGVDVFFVISGFLISSHLLESIEATGRIRFAQFYARRARRILPAALAVAALTAIALVLFAPPLVLPRMLLDAVATVLYVPNIRFAVQGTDYLADHAASAYQHYWSLGVEEQFYLLWPLLLLAIALLARRRIAVVAVLVGVVTAVSLVACIALTQTQQPLAFFLLPTRAWELLAGALVAIAVLRRVPLMSSWLAASGAWAGVVAVLAGGVLLDDSTPFPGVAAILPVAGTAAVIYFGTARPRGGPDVLLSVRPMQYIGLISYSLYLVHWPLLIVPALAMGEPMIANPWLRVLLGIVVAIPLAALLHRFVEDPGRRSPPLVRRPPRVTLLATGAVTATLALALGGTAAWSATRPIAGGGDAQTAPSAPVAPPPVATVVPANLTPSLRDVAEDVPDLYPDGCHHDTVAISVQDCAYGSPGAGYEVALFGDSHSAQWLPALQQSDETHPMSIQTYTKSSCPAVDVTVLVRNVPYDACDQWRSAVLVHLVQDPPDLVVISSYADYVLEDSSEGDARLDAWSDGLERVVGALETAGSAVLVIADTPHFPTAPAECVSTHLTAVDACAGDRGTSLNAAQAAAERAATEAVGGDFLDLTPFLCDARICPVVMFDLLVYRDVNHLTSAFVRYLAPAIGSAVFPAQL